MNIRMYTAAREATTKARNVASAIQQVARQVNDDNKDIMEKVDKNTQVRSKRKAELELAAATNAKRLAAKQAKISGQQAGLAMAQIVTSFAASRVGKGIDKESENNDANVKDEVKDKPDKKDGFLAKAGRVLAEAAGVNAVKGAFGKKDDDKGGDDKAKDKVKSANENEPKTPITTKTEEPASAGLLDTIVNAVKKAIQPPKTEGEGDAGKDGDDTSKKEGTLLQRVGDAVGKALGVQPSDNDSENVTSSGNKNDDLKDKVKNAVMKVLQEENVTEEGKIPGEGTDKTKEDNLINKITKAISDVLGKEVQGKDENNNIKELASSGDGDNKDTNKTGNAGDNKDTNKTGNGTEKKPSPVENQGPSAQTAQERSGGEKGPLIDPTRGAGLSSIRGLDKALVALGMKKSDDPNQKPSGISEGTPIGDLLKQLAELINQINAMTSSGEGSKSRFGDFATKANRMAFMLTEATDEDLNGAGRFLRDLIGKPVTALATAPLNAVGTGLQSLQNRANGNLADPERQVADELAETGNVSQSSQDGLRASLENRVRAGRSDKTTNEAGNPRALTEGEGGEKEQVQKGVDAFQGNVLSQKLGKNVAVKTDENGAVTVSNSDKPGTSGAKVSQQDVRRALAGDKAALDRIGSALTKAEGKKVGDNTTAIDENTTTADKDGKGVKGAPDASNAEALANQATDPKTQAILDQVNSFAAKGVKGFEGAEIVGGEVTLTDGRTVTGNNDGGLEVSGANTGAANFGITGNAVSALEGNNPIVSNLETQRLVKGIDAGLNLSDTGNTNTNLDFNANAASTKADVIGDRNNSVQLTFKAGTPEADGRGLTVSPGGVNQLSIRGIEKAADNKLGRKDRDALGLTGDRPRVRGLGVQDDAPFLKGLGEARVNGRSALEAAFGGAGIKASDRSAQQSATDLSNLGDAVDIFGSLKNRSQKIGDPTEQLKDKSFKNAVNNVTANLRGSKNLGEAQKTLDSFGLSDNEKKGILSENTDGTFSVSRRAIKKALEGRVGITRTDAATTGQTGESNTAVTPTDNTTNPTTPVAQAGGANTTQDVQAVIRGNDALSAAAGATGNVLGSFTVKTDSVAGEGEEARGNTRVTNGTGSGTDLKDSTEKNVRRETARRLSQSTAQGGLGIGKIDAKSLVFNDKGELTGINTNGKTQSLDEFAAANAKLSSANAARRNRILGLTGKNAEGGLSANGIKSVASGIVGDVRSESNSGLNSALSGASDAARSTLAALKGGDPNAIKDSDLTVNADGSIALKNSNGNFLISKDGKLQQEITNKETNEKTIGEAFANQILGQAADSEVNKEFANRKKAIQDLTNDINEAFQVQFKLLGLNLFKIGEKVSNINVDFDAAGNITGAGVKLDDGSQFNLANDPSTGSLRAINARGAKGTPANQSVLGGIDYFNNQSRTGGFESKSRSNGFKSILEGIGATNVSIDERDNGRSALKKDDNNSFNNNFTQEGRLRFNLNDQYLDIGYAVDKNGGISLNLDGASDEQKAAIQTALTGAADVNKARVPVTTSAESSNNSNDTTPVQTKQVAGINVRANAVISNLEKDSDFQAILKTNDPNQIRTFISNALQGSDLNRQVSDNLAGAITASNVTISAGQNLAKALNESGVTGDEATAVTNALNGSNLLQNNVLVNPGGPDSARVVNKALKEAGIEDADKREAITAKLLAPTSATFSPNEIGTGPNADPTTQFARLFGAGNRGNDALTDINGNLSQNLTPAQQQNARTQYNNTVAAERAIINSIGNTTGAGNPKFLTVGLQALLGDEKASALVSTDDKKSEQITSLKNDLVGLNETQAQERLNVFLRSEGLENNSIDINEIATFKGKKKDGDKEIGTDLDKLKDLSAVDIRGRVNVEGSYDGRSQITGKDIQYGPGAASTIPSLSVQQDASGKYTVNVGGAPPTGSGPTVGAANTDIQENLRNRYANPEDKKTELQKIGTNISSFLDTTTRFLGETLDAILPGIQAYKKAMEDLEEARVRLKAASDQEAAARKYAEEMGVTFGNTNGDGEGGEGGEGGPPALTGGGNTQGGVNVAENTQGTNNNNNNNNGPNATQNAGNNEGTASTDADTDAADEISSTEADEQAGTAELLNEITSDSNFASIAVLIGLNPGMLIEQAQQMDMLEQLTDTIQQLQSPFSNPVQSMREFVERLEMAQSGAQLPQDGIVL